MKKSGFVIILCMGLLHTSLYTQVRPGIKLGWNNSAISKTLLEHKQGVYIGGILDIPLTDRYTLQPELYYSGQGGESRSTEFGDVEIDYLSIAATNKFYVDTNKGFHFILGAGLDINIKNNFVAFFNGEGDGEISPFDVVVFGGLGYEFNFGLILEARYKQGTVSIDFFGADDLYEENGSNLNEVFQIGAAYKFKI
ncbi:outer membrane beta-barrel protein [Maribacter sp. 2304DJ31-5]|uniref:outer membrane beta-barrel protein n=1 Tax=Maribacter sp. 2304DJ31-5 TaxID=3386273 RepID=UPI0039BD7F96